MTDDDGTFAMVDANVLREEVLPSQKAFALKMKLDAIKHQGSRSDLTSPQNVKKAIAEIVDSEETQKLKKQTSRGCKKPFILGA